MPGSEQLRNCFSSCQPRRDLLEEYALRASCQAKHMLNVKGLHCALVPSFALAQPAEKLLFARFASVSGIFQADSATVSLLEADLLGEPTCHISGQPKSPLSWGVQGEAPVSASRVMLEPAPFSLQSSETPTTLAGVLRNVSKGDKQHPPMQQWVEQ